MGNAWVDPVTQYSAYMGPSSGSINAFFWLTGLDLLRTDFAYEKGLLKKKSKPAKLAEAAWTKCRAELDKTAPPAPSLSPSATAKFSTRPGKRKRELEKRATPIIVDVCEEMLGPILDGGKTKSVLAALHGDASGLLADLGDCRVNGTTVVPVTYNITQLLPSGTEWPLGIGQMTRYLDVRALPGSSCKRGLIRRTFVHSDQMS